MKSPQRTFRAVDPYTMTDQVRDNPHNTLLSPGTKRLKKDNTDCGLLSQQLMSQLKYNERIIKKVL